MSIFYSEGVVNMEKNKKYYLGLDIGTDSVGYAAAGEDYSLLKYKQDPVWGVTTFEAASLAQERRAFRTARRRLDRRKQRVQLLSELFATEICKIDKDFFLRRKESALFAEDTQSGVKIFNSEGLTDKQYHAKYPTIHHLICELMKSDAPHDVRLVYLACAWLVANRGHFLFDVSSDNIEEILDVSEPYARLRDYLKDECSCGLPWSDDVAPQTILQILQMKVGVKKKQEAFKEQIFGGKKPGKEATEEFPFSADAMVTLLCGGKVKPADLFANDTYAEVESVSLEMEDEALAAIVSELDAEGELLLRLQALYNCALLNNAQNGKQTISEAKVDIYEQHKKDLKWLKYFIRKYIPDKYTEVFRASGKVNYVAYSGNMKNGTASKRAKKEEFSDAIYKLVKEREVEACDKARYDDMLDRLKVQSFLPKQKDTTNRVIPQQLHRYELKCILDRAAGYLPLLSKKDEAGRTVGDKILAIFDFRIPYFVGPLNAASPNAWIVRKPGKIYPWNFEEQVDLDASEQKFIDRMTNYCTYLPGEDVLPVKSLLYERFTVLNELNNLKVNDRKIPVEVKQELYTELFMQPKRVTPKRIAEYLCAHGYLQAGDEISGLDISVKSSLKTYHSFRRLLDSGMLSKDAVEEIIKHAAYSEDKQRMNRWLSANHPQLSAADRKYILGLNLKEFGRLSRTFLTGLLGVDKQTGEVFTIIEAMWKTNDNLMQLLSDRYTFKEQVEAFAEAYYAGHPMNISDRLSEMYISNAVKRPIIRTLEIVDDVVKTLGRAPEKIFVEMARGGSPEQKGKRTLTRKQQLLDLYKTVKTEDARLLAKELEAMGEMADNRLQSDKLFMYYLQMGKCLYTGEAIDLTKLSDGTYNIEHIYPQSFVKDDSILNNEILVLSTANGEKSDTYPVPAGIQKKMYSVWAHLHEIKLMSDEKFRRLTRTTGFTEEEKHQFINRQLTETQQSTKAVAQLLKERYPDAEIVYVKAGLVSEFRQEFNMLKCRAVNDLHHAKDAYLNIVVGNVYHEKFTKRPFDVGQKYSVKTKTLFSYAQRTNGATIWRGAEDLDAVRKTVRKNAVHLTRYSFCRKGGFFDQMPLKAAEGLHPRKSGLDTERYGGYNKPTASFFVLAKCALEKKTELMILPISLLDAEKFASNEADAKEIAKAAAQAITGKQVSSVSLPLGLRKLKVNSVISFDGLRMTLGGKSSGGRQLIVSPMMPLILNPEEETYIKALSSFVEKQTRNASIRPDTEHDGISAEKNLKLYDRLADKLSASPFAGLPGNQKKVLDDGREKFSALPIEQQIRTLLNAVMLFSPLSAGVDLTAIGGSKSAGGKLVSSTVSNWKKNYNKVYIVDQSASGLHEMQSGNLLELL